MQAIRFTYLYIIYVALLFVWGCANVVTPAGGEKDLLPPSVVSYYPDSAATNFTGTTIKIQFDEFIQLNDVFNQVIVSPPLNNQPEFKLKGKTLNIALKDTLKENTTYTINFGQSIKDITEGNILDNFTYVFSTGATLDSLQVSGSVYDVLTQKPVEKAFVVLYYQPTDTSFTTARPYYFARTDKMGNWTIRNIRNGDYAVYGLEDMNFNYYYDLPNERIAFSDTLLHVEQNVSNHKLQLFSEEKIPQSLLEIKSPRYGLTRLVFAKDARDVTINYNGADTSSQYIYSNTKGDSLYFWKSNYALDSHQLTIAFDTTLLTKSIPIKQFNKDSVFAKQKNSFLSNVIIVSKAADARADWDPNQEIRLRFLNPVKTIADTPQIYQDTILLGKMNIRIDSNDARDIYLNYPFTTEKPYDIYIRGNAFTDIFGLPNVADTFKLQTRKADAYATLSVMLSNATGKDLVCYLTKFDGTIVKQWLVPQSSFDSALNNIYTIKQNYLLPGVYRLKVVVDGDSNATFTTGDLSKKQQPEKIIYYPTDQNLRANWENEIEWEVK